MKTRLSWAGIFRYVVFFMNRPKGPIFKCCPADHHFLSSSWMSTQKHNSNATSLQVVDRDGRIILVVSRHPSLPNFTSRNLLSMSTAFYKSNAGPKLLANFSHQSTKQSKRVEVWRTTCIVTKFGKNQKGPSCSVLINPSNPELSGVSNFPYFPR